MTDGKIWKPLDLVKVSAEYLATKQVPGPRLDAELLLCEILGLPRRVDLYAGFEREISGKELAAYRELIRRRAAREPVSRILGRREFMGIGFKVTPDVLSPRPETELLVETILESVRPKRNFAEAPVEEDAAAGPVEAEEPEMLASELEKLLDSYAEDVDDADAPDAPPAAMPPPRPNMAAPRSLPAAPRPARGGKEAPAADAGPAVAILDLGTGSGCIAVSLAANLPRAAVTAVDASPKALAVAKQNAASAGVAERVTFRQGDWFGGCPKGARYDVIVSNPPYLVEGDPAIWPEVSGYDPAISLYAGTDGLDCYRRIIPAAGEWLNPGGLLFLEVGEGQAERVAGMLRGRDFADVAILRDYGGVERVVRAAAMA